MRTILVLLFIAYDKDGVTTRAPIVLISGSDGSAALTVHQGQKDIIESLDSLDLAAHDHHLPVGHLTKFEILLLVADISGKQVFDLLIVNLQVLHAELYLGTLSIHDTINCLKDIADGSRNNTIHDLNFVRYAVATIFDCIDD